MVETPVLYITFARPEYASQSFAAIKKAQPKKLYFYSNKAREEKPDEVARNEEVRSYIKQIDWNCEVKTWFRDEYVDVFTSIWGAIDWIFDNEEKAIVIEEDVVASLAFFDYIEKTIDKYKDVNDIWIISGNNCLPEYFPKGYSCYPTRWADIYGWASWRAVWRSVDWKMVQWNKYKKSKAMKKYWKNNIICAFMNLYYGIFYKRITYSDYKPWDGIFIFSMRVNNGFCLTPYVNLCKDIGINGANHDQGFESPFAKIGINDVTFPSIIAPENNIEVENKFDVKIFWKIIFKGIMRRKIKKYLRI